MATNFRPEGYRTVTPYMTVSGAAKAIEWYKTVFGAEEIMRMATPDGRLMHAEIKIGDSFIMLGDEWPEYGGLQSPQKLGGTATGLAIYVPDCDAIFSRAVEAGASAKMSPSDMFWGDRYSKVVDPFGHEWSISTHIEDVAPDEMNRRAEAMAQDMAKGQGS